MRTNGGNSAHKKPLDKLAGEQGTKTLVGGDAHGKRVFVPTERVDSKTAAAPSAFQ